jgi:excisionase family DNA binding protein
MNHLHIVAVDIPTLTAIVAQAVESGLASANSTNANQAPLQEPARVPKMLTAAEVRKILGISRPTLRALEQRGELQPLRIGTALRFAETDVLAYVAGKGGRDGV